MQTSRYRTCIATLVAVAGLSPFGCGKTEHSAGAPASAGGAATAASVPPESEALKLCEELRMTIERGRNAATRTDFSAERRIAEALIAMAGSRELPEKIRSQIEASEKRLNMKQPEWIDFYWDLHSVVVPLSPGREDPRPAAADNRKISVEEFERLQKSAQNQDRAAGPTASPEVEKRPGEGAKASTRAQRKSPLGELPDHFHDNHLDFLLQILEKHRPELAVRLRKKELPDTVWFLFQGCGEWGAGAYDHECASRSIKSVYELTPSDNFRKHADLAARYTYEVADPKKRLKELEKEAEGMLAVVEGERIVSAWNDVFRTSIRQQAEDYREGKGEHPFQIAYPLVKKHLPEEAARYAAFVRNWHANQKGLGQEYVTDSIWEVYRLQTLLREHDVDKNGVQDYWTADVAGLFRLKVDGKPLRECYPNDPPRFGTEIEQSDAAPLTPGDTVYAPAGADEPFRYRFQTVNRDAQAAPYAQDTDRSGKAWRNTKQFAVCAFPREYPGAGRQTYLINETGVVWFKDTAGKPVEQFPTDLEADGWSRAAKQPTEVARAEQQQQHRQERSQMLVDLQQGKLDADSLIRVLGSGAEELPAAMILELVKRHDQMEPGLPEAEKIRKAMRLVAAGRLPELVAAFKARVGVTTHGRQTAFTLKELSAGELDQPLAALVNQWTSVSTDASLRDRVDAALSLWCYDGRTTGVQPLLAAAAAANDVETRKSAVALAVHAVENLDELSQIILKAAEDESADVRKTAIRAATRFYQRPEASKLSSVLIRRLSDSDPDVMESALESLGILRDHLNLDKQQRSELIARALTIFGNRESSKLHDNLVNVLFVTGWEQDSEADDAPAIFAFLSAGGHIPNLELPEAYGGRVWGTGVGALGKRAWSDGPSGTSARRVLLNLGSIGRRVLADNAERRLRGRLSVVPEEIRLRYFHDVSDKHLHECVSANLNLRDIPLHGTSVTDEGMELLHSSARLKKLDELRALDVSGTSISDVGAKSISGLASLETLNISFTGLTDDGLGHLKSLKNLKQLDVSSTRVTATGLREFQTAVPQCKIQNEPPLRVSAASKTP